jgi:hypothetical protein
MVSGNLGREEFAALLCHAVRAMEEAIGAVTHFERFPVTGIEGV